jgi:hypothetical protein
LKCEKDRADWVLVLFVVLVVCCGVHDVGGDDSDYATFESAAGEWVEVGEFCEIVNHLLFWPQMRRAVRDYRYEVCVLTEFLDTRYVLITPGLGDSHE